METGRQPIEPPPNRWRLPDPNAADESGLCGIGADLAPGTVLAAYRSGIFPMPLRRKTLGWWSPDPRGVIPLDGLIVSRSLRKSCRRYEVRVNTRFREVMERCGDPKRPHGWITPQFVDAYEELHTLGWVHSVETYLDGALVGGLYGVGRVAEGHGRHVVGRPMDDAASGVVGRGRHSPAPLPGDVGSCGRCGTPMIVTVLVSVGCPTDTGAQSAAAVCRQTRLD
jgi:leucyl/phenylalanyl-tRNA--protein transferase